MTPYCPNCGTEAVWEPCWQCGGDGHFDAYEDDPMWYDPGDTEPCSVCHGMGGSWWCSNMQCERKIIPETELVTWD